MLTVCKCPVIRLSVEVDLNHLTPASRPEDSKNISQVVVPSVRVNTARHQAAVDKIEVIRRECRSGR
jgi:hypothetical protein